MRNLFVKALYGLITALATASVALALVVPPEYAPRMFGSQQTHYIRFVVNFNDCVLVSGTCTTKRGAIPYNAFILRAYSQIITNFNSGTTDTIELRATSATTAAQNGTLVAATSVHSGAGGGAALTVLAANLGITVTGDGTAQSGLNGGFDVYSLYTQTGAAPTAGQAVYLMEYAASNDGSCIQYPMNVTTPAVC